MQQPRANSAGRAPPVGPAPYYPNQQYPMQAPYQQQYPYGQPPTNNVNIPPQNYMPNAQPAPYGQQPWPQQGPPPVQQPQTFSPEQDPQWADYYRKLDEWHRYEQHRQSVIAQQQSQQQARQQAMHHQMMMQQQMAMQQQQYQQSPLSPRQQVPPQPKQSTPQLLPPGAIGSSGNIQQAVKQYLGEAEKQRQMLQQKQGVIQPPAPKSQQQIGEQYQPSSQALPSAPQIPAQVSQQDLPPPPKQEDTHPAVITQPLKQQSNVVPAHESAIPAPAQYHPSNIPMQSVGSPSSQHSAVQQQYLQQEVDRHSKTSKNTKNAEIPSQRNFASIPNFTSQPVNSLGAPPGQFISTATFNANQANINVSQFDLIRARLKSTRDKIFNLIGREEVELASIDQELQAEKDNDLKNKKKVVYLLKQRKHYSENIENLQTRMQVLIKTLSDLNQQNLDKDIVNVLEQANQYMQAVQDELQTKNWRDVLEEASHRPEDAFAGLVDEQSDPEIDRMYAELEKQVITQKSKIAASKLKGQTTSTLAERVIQVPLAASEIKSSQLKQGSNYGQVLNSGLRNEDAASKVANTSRVNQQPFPEIVIQAPSQIPNNSPLSMIGLPQSQIRGQTTTSNISINAPSSQQQVLSQTSSLLRQQGQRQQEVPLAQQTSAVRVNADGSRSAIQSQSSIVAQQKSIPQATSSIRPSIIKHTSKMQVVVQEEPQFGSVMSNQPKEPQAPIQQTESSRVQYPLAQFGSTANVMQASRLGVAQPPSGEKPGSSLINIPQPGSQIFAPPLIPPPPQIFQQTPNNSKIGYQNASTVRVPEAAQVNKSMIPPKPSTTHASMYSPGTSQTPVPKHASEVAFKK